MEDVLDTYQLPYDAEIPMICIDESSKQLLEEVREPIAASPGTPARHDDTYKRCGTGNIFMCVEPLTGRVITKVTEHRTAIDFAQFLAEVSEEQFPEAKKFRLVTDNLNTHSLACLYEAFAPERARELAKKFEIHHTPKHGSWLDVAEIELSVLARQCLDRRIGSLAELRKEVRAWTDDHNKGGHKVSWHFTAKDARIKLKRLYPSVIA
jgi:DDE superfamily endonuclease